MPNTLSKYLDILLYVMIGFTAVFIALFYIGGEEPNTAYTTPVNTNILLIWGWVLFVVSVGLALVFPVIQLFVNPKGAKKGLVGLGILGVIILVSYGMSDGTLLNIAGYTGPDNNPGTLMFADTVLFTMYILGIGTILAIVVTEIIRKLR